MLILLFLTVDAYFLILYSLCLVDLPDDLGDEEDVAVEEDVVGSEDEMADFIVDEDGNGHPRRYSFFCSCDLMVVLCHV